MKIDEVMELGKRLRRAAERRGVGVNASHMMVHDVMMRAFAVANTRQSGLQAALATHLRRKLETREIGHQVSL